MTSHAIAAQPDDPPETHSRFRSLAPRAFLGAAVLAAIVLTMGQLPLQQWALAFLEWSRGLGAAGPAALVAAYVVACVLFLPGSILTLGAGFLFGLGTGVVTVSIGSCMGAAAAFWIGRTVARGSVSEKVARYPKLAAVDQAVGREGFKIVLLTRLSPLFPFNLLNYFYGITRVSFRDYLLASWIGMLPGTVMYVYLGSVTRDLTALAAGGASAGSGGHVLTVVGLLATLAATAKVTAVARAALDDALADRQSDGTVARGEPRPAAPDEPEFAVEPLDAHNRILLDNVHPPGWKNPEPAPLYNMVVIGAGPAGLVTAAAAAGLGGRVALVEKHLIGGDCLNVGCVPSKALIRAARAAAEVRRSGEFGVKLPGDVTVDFPAVMERMRRLRAQLSPHDSAARFRDLGIDVFIGTGRFTSPTTVEVAGRTLRFDKACIATGARATAPRIPGLEAAGYLTNETVFNLTELPAGLAVIGAGPIGCELAQSFARFGSKVELLDIADHVLVREDHDAAEIVQQRLVREGVRLHLEAKLQRVETSGRRKRIVFENAGGAAALEVDEILVGAGRAPNVRNMGLELAGIDFDQGKGVHVDDRLRTSNPRVYAAGDVASMFKFTHAADALARIVVRNALFMGRSRASALQVPWCTYTQPEIAHVGMYEADASAAGLEVDTYVQQLEEVDRAVLDGEAEGFVKVHVRKGSDRILGATIVADHAGEMISEISVAMAAGLGLGAIASVIHPYPTQAEGIRKLGDAYNRTRLTVRVKRVMSAWLGWNRRGAGVSTPHRTGD